MHQRAKARQAKELFEYSNIIRPATPVIYKAKQSGSFGNTILYFNECDEMVDEAIALSEPEKHYSLEVPAER